MQMTPEARAWLEAAVRRILARHPLGDAERAAITHELMSHLHGVGEARALAAGRTDVTREDLAAAHADAGGDAELAAAFVQPLAKPIVRVLFWRRLGAFTIDALLLGIALAFVHGTLAFLLQPFMPGPGLPVDSRELGAVLPWGFHDPTLSVALQGVIAFASATVVLGYFALFEAHEGRTLGKRALDLRVMRLDGRPMTYRESLLRNLAKLSPLILLLDVLVMLIAFPAAKQRVSDRIADTIVIRA